jgi:hypothetical protein
MTTPETYVLNIYRGDNYAWQFVFWNDAAKTDPLDLTDVTPKAEIRNKPGGNRVTEMTCAVTLPNIIDLTLSAANSHTLQPGQRVWDLQLTYLSGDVSTLLAGPVLITGDVTDSDPE